MTDGSRATTPPIERVLAGRRDRRSAAKDIASRVALSVDLGLLHPLEQLPRDEELATAFGVAPITVRRALRRLCDEGILVRRRGRTGGTFVSERPPRGELGSLLFVIDTTHTRPGTSGRVWIDDVQIEVEKWRSGEVSREVEK